MSNYENNEIILKPMKLTFNCDPIIENSMSTVTFADSLRGQQQHNSMALSWINLTYYEKSIWANKSTLILSQLKGKIEFGTLTALMGPSGAGKTTLLRCMFGINRSGLSKHTEIYISKYEDIRPCFIVQDQREHLFSKLTVKESLMFASKLKNRANNKTGKNYHKTKVNKLLQELMLTDCADTLVGKCSGGEQKRVVIALEMTSELMPNLICIDEPTSGLDSNSAEQVIECLQDMAYKHRIAIVASIHQPNSDMLLLFDQLYVLANGGRCVYAGAPNDLRDRLLDCNIQCAEWEVPIEVLLKLSSKKNKDFISTLGIECIDLGPPDEVIKLVVKTYEQLDSLKSECKLNGALVLFGFSGNRGFHFMDMWYLFQRAMLYSWVRQRNTLVSQFLCLFGVGFLLTNLYDGNIGSDDGCAPNNATKLADNVTVKTYADINQVIIGESLTEQNLKFLFFFVMFLIFMQFNSVIFSFPAEVKCFLNEHRNCWYSTGSYLWSKTIIETPILLINTYLYICVGYYGTSQPDFPQWYNGFYDVSERFALFVLLVVMAVISTQGLLMFVGIITANNTRLAPILSVAILLIMTLFSGFYISIVEYNQFLQKITNLSSIKLVFQSVLVIIYGHNRCASSASLVLRKFGIIDEQLWTNFWWLLANLLAYRVLAFIVLMLQANADWFFKVRNAKKVYEFYALRNKISSGPSVDSKFLRSRKSIAVHNFQFDSSGDESRQQRRDSRYSFQFDSSFNIKL